MDGRRSDNIEWPAMPATSARASSSAKRARASRRTGCRPASPNRASAGSDRAGGTVSGESTASTIDDPDSTSGPISFT